MAFLPSLLSLGLAMALLPSASASGDQTLNMYTIRSPDTHRKAVEIIDLGTFILTNSEDGRPKAMTPFFLNIFETREGLSEEALRNVEYATSDFLQTELNSIFTNADVAEVNTKILQQERVVEQMEDSTLPQTARNSGALRRGLRAVPGSKFLVNVNVTFDREPSPDASRVDDSLQSVMKDLDYLVNNMTASEDPELGYVFMAYREEISENKENPTVSAQKPVQNNTDSQSINYIIPIVIAFVLFAALIAMFVIKRRRRRVEESNQKAQEDLAFLDEESNVFSFENSPSKSSARKVSAMSPQSMPYDGDEFSRFSASQGSMSQSPSNGVGSPTKSYLSGASTVKVSNARLIALPSKLSELASTSLFAFSEEDEYLDSESEAAGQRAGTPVSVQPSEASNGSSLDRIMNGKSEEDKSLVVGSPRHPSAQASPSKSVFSSIFSSHFFSGGGDGASQFAGSQLTAPINNTSDAVKRRAAKNGGRSFSLSPQKNNPPSTRSRAKSEAGMDDEEDDSVFDFLHTSPVKRENDANKNEDTSTPTSKEMTGLDVKSLNEALSQAEDVVNASSGKATESPAPGTKSNNTSMVSEGGKSNHSSNKSPSRREVDQPAEEFSDEYDSLSDDDIHGSFPRRSRRHAKSTTRDGTFAYQTNAMAPQDWSMTDGLPDDDTLSEHGADGAFPRSGPRSPRSTQKTTEADPKSPMSAHSRSSYSASAVTQNSQASKTDNSSQASTSRQLINDLVWLSKKIAGVKQSAVDSAPGDGGATVPALGAPPPIEPVDSLSYASQDGLISPTSTNGDAPNSTSKHKNSSQSQTPRNTTAAGVANTSIVCRDCFAPPGKLGIVIHSTKDGPAVHEVKDGSCLKGSIFPGDLIITVDDVDTRAFTAAQLMKMMAEKSQMQRKITVLHFEEETQAKDA